MPGRPSWSYAAGLTRSRRRLGLALCVLGLPFLTAVLLAVRDRIGLDSVLLVYLLAVVVVAAVGGLGPALTAAVGSFLLANWFLTPPYYTFRVEGSDQLVELVVFVVVAALVSVIVEVGGRNRVVAERNRMEAGLLSRLASSEVGTATPEQVLEQVRDVFELTGVDLVGPGGGVLAAVGDRAAADRSLAVSTNAGLVLRGYGPRRFAEDSRLLRTLAETAARCAEEQRLAQEATRAEQLAATDRVRAALLAAVSHDLRTPLSGIKAAVSSLRQDDVAWTAEQTEQLLASIEESTDRLAAVIANLLDLSRIQAGAVSVHPTAIAVDEVVGRALLGVDAVAVDVDVPEDLPVVLADAGLLERILVNLVANATRYTPPHERIAVRAKPDHAGHVQLDVVDHGPGVPREHWGEMFAPFQRLGDRETRSGLGIGLAIARGFSEAMNACLGPAETPGGGLTMRLLLPVAR